ncbi:MAG: hypothetical protein RMM98_09115 [Acidobacteriota bacterium]|nr:hypothetical protein [Blastocatellia bacterium]MDW8239764.1 hypothetical protein [Acidobacteriota bacterium]
MKIEHRFTDWLIENLFISESVPTFSGMPIEKTLKEQARATEYGVFKGAG